MLRFILKRQMKDEFEGSLHTDFLFTIVADVPELEVALRKGGKGLYGYDYSSFVGIEVFDDEKTKP